MVRLPVVDESVMGIIAVLLEGSTEPLKQYHWAVAKTLAYLADKFREEIRLRDLALHACVVPSHLRRLFREELGLSPMRFLSLLRVESAKLILADHQCSVTEAGLASGFTDLRSFERAFKKWVGCTPREYRKKLLSQPKRSPDTRQ